MSTPTQAGSNDRSSDVRSSDVRSSDALALLGSSRSRGNTRVVLEHVLGESGVEVVDLQQLRISPYDYDHRNRDDDFLALAERCTQAQTLVLATPVYWYSMSAWMKIFLDRLSDLLSIRKDLGRALADRRLFVIASSTTEEPPEGFEIPFRLTAEYLDMRWGGFLHAYFENEGVLRPEDAERARQLGERIFAGS